MSFLNEDKIGAARIGFQALFNQAIQNLRKPDAIWLQLANEIASTHRVEQHNWMGTLPGFEEWLGERNMAKLKNFSFQITNKKWANGLEVDQDDIDDDNLGLYAPKIAALAEQAMLHRLTLLLDLLCNGFAPTKYGPAYDALAYFSANHAGGSNYEAHSLDDSGAYDSAWQKALEQKDLDGQPLNVTPTHLIVGPKLRATARGILVAERDASGASNTNFQTAQLIVSPKLVGDFDDYWFLADLSKPIKPLIFQNRREVQFRAGCDCEKFKTDKLHFGADARYNAGYGLFQLVVGSDAAS